MFLISHLKKFDWLLAASAMLICGIGLLSIYSSSLGIGRTVLNFQKQAIFLGAGLLLMFVISFFDYRTIKDNSYLILGFYSLCLLALAGLLLFGSPIRGVRGWYKLGAFALSPVEFTKIILVILLEYRHFGKP